VAVALVVGEDIAYPADFGKGGFVVSFIEKDEKWRQLTLDGWIKRPRRVRI
jgi:hypothetical protein